MLVTFLYCLTNQNKFYRRTKIKKNFRLKLKTPFLKTHFLKICEEKDKFTTIVFGKDIFNVVYTNFSSFIALSIRIDILQRCFTIFSDFSKFHLKLKDSRKHLLTQRKMLT